MTEYRSDDQEWSQPVQYDDIELRALTGDQRSDNFKVAGITFTQLHLEILIAIVLTRLGACSKKGRGAIRAWSSLNQCDAKSLITKNQTSERLIMIRILA